MSCENVELRTLLGIIEKRMLSRLPAMQNMVKMEKAMPSTAASSFNTHSTDRVKPEKWTAVSLYLDELLIQKCKFRDRFTVNC